MSQYTMFLWQVNLTAEMLFILHARLCVQVADVAVRRRILSDILVRVFAEDVLQEALRTTSRSPPSLLTTYAIFVRLCEGGPVHLTGNSMKKLFDLMVTMVKYELCSMQYPGDVLPWTYTHLDHVARLFTSAAGVSAINPITFNSKADIKVAEVLKKVVAYVDVARDKLGINQLAQIRSALLNNVLHHHIKVSVLVEQGCQRRDSGSFVLPLQPYLMPLAENVMTPGLVQYYDGANVVREERLPHPYAAFAPLPQSLHRSPAEAQSQTLCAMTPAIGCNLFAAHSDVLAAQERELSTTSGAHQRNSNNTATHNAVSSRSNDNATSATRLGLQGRPSATEVEAYNSAMERFATLVRPAGATTTAGVAADSRFTLDILLDLPSNVSSSSPSRAVGVAEPSTTSAAPPSSPLHCPSTTETRKADVSRSSAAQSRHNQELMQLMAQLDDTGQPHITAGQATQGDDLLDIMDAL